ncbi:MAG: CRISPR system precrRNA processing endoribonuclease RAMP protein Cas6 [Oscillospiraceae bacterium]|nr:CRISPR system precrRNA processing endoribonuclease RAMP protein Cas6 [Oscillospiraceae bacterium]
MNPHELLASIGYIRLQIKMKLVSGGTPRGKWFGSAIRGAIGSAMLSRFCPERQFHCETCEHLCSTGILFSTAKPDRSEEAVNPYIIECPENALEDGVLQFWLTFFGNGLFAASDVMLALRDGIVLGKEQLSFTLCEINDAVTDKPLFDGLLMRKPDTHFLQYNEESFNRCCIEFLTPYRTKFPAADFGFAQLTRAMLRRLSTLMRQSGIEPDFDYKSIIAKAEQIKMEYRILTPVRRTRYSSRTASRWDVTGFTGAMIVSGDFTDFLPLLRITEIIGAGKLCVMGLGKIRISALQ